MNVQDAIDRAKAIAAQLAAQDAVPSYKRPASDAVPPPEPKRRFTNFVDEIHIPGQYVGLVSGKNGETLKLIERGYNVEINLKSSDREGKLSIAGDPQDVGQVKDVVQEIMRTGSIPLNLLQSGDQSDSVSILIPGNKVGLIIGKGGETITSLQSKSGAKIILDSQERTSNDKTVTIQGSPAAIAKAKELIKEVIGTGPGVTFFL
jgi:far upstream element-binding protein